MEGDEDLRLCATSTFSPLWERREPAFRNGIPQSIRFQEYNDKDERSRGNVAGSPRKVSIISNKSIENESFSYRNSLHSRSDDPQDFTPASTMGLIIAGSEMRDFDQVEKINKNELPKKVWVTALPAGMERTICMNSSPMTGKKYRKRIKKALTDRLDEAECMLNCKILRTDDSRYPSKSKETGRRSSNSDQGGCSDTEIEFLYSDSTVSLPGLSDVKDVRHNLQLVDKSSVSKSAINEEARLSNIKIQAEMKLNKLRHQFTYLENQLVRQGAAWAEPNQERLSQLYKTRQIHRKIKDQIKTLEETLKTIEDLHRAEAAINFGSRSVKDKTLPISVSNSAPRFIFFDGGDHTCKFCSELFTEVGSLITHVYDTHVHFFSSLPPENRPWTEPQTQLEENGNCQRQPFKGCEFLLPCQGFFCDLCKVNVSDETIAKKHLESELHNINYAKYCELNPNYENEMEEDLNRTKNMKERIEELSLQTFSTDNFNSSNIQIFDETLQSSNVVDSSNDDFELVWLSDTDEDEMDEFSYTAEHDGSNDVDLLEDQCLKSAAN